MYLSNDVTGKSSYPIAVSNRIAFLALMILVQTLKKRNFINILHFVTHILCHTLRGTLEIRTGMRNILDNGSGESHPVVAFLALEGDRRRLGYLLLEVKP